MIAWVLFLFRRLAQDRGSLRLREPSPAVPVADAAADAAS
jgi:hypothetical protein